MIQLSCSCSAAYLAICLVYTMYNHMLRTTRCKRVGLSAGKLTNGKMERASVYPGPTQDPCFQLHWASALRLTCHTSHLILVLKTPLMQAQTRRSGLWAVCLALRALPWCAVHQHVYSNKWMACSAKQGKRCSQAYAISIPG